MKNFLKDTFISSALILFFSFLISCGSDDSEDTGPSYEFINQNTQGTIDGNSFDFGSGTVEVSPFDSNEFSLDLYDDSETFTDPCELFGFGDFVNVFFSVPNAVGLYELSIDFSGGNESRTVTLFNPETVLNIIATEGAVEILSISDTELTGRIDVRAGESFVNGNFTVVFCPE
jgi:hypothetical protein